MSGWQLQGGVSVSATEGHDGHRVLYAQAMTLDTPEPAK